MVFFKVQYFAFHSFFQQAEIGPSRHPAQVPKTEFLRHASDTFFKRLVISQSQKYPNGTHKT